MPIRLCDRDPRVPADRLLAEMVPPPRFAEVSFDSYRPDPAQPSQQEAVRASLDHFVDLTRHLAQVHPSSYGFLLDDVRTVCLEEVRTVGDQAAALRLVVLADRLYDRDLPVLASGVSFDQLFAPALLEGGYRKKYFRAVSRLVALANEGVAAT